MLVMMLLVLLKMLMMLFINNFDDVFDMTSANLGCDLPVVVDANAEDMFLLLLMVPVLLMLLIFDFID